jgi:predicted nuclease of predicted toxin-antitoxin system
MSLRILVDMNLSVEWIPLLEEVGWSAIHWSAIGDPRADDSTIMAWASAQKYAVFTHDLDFGTALALTHAGEPSVIQVRAHIPSRAIHVSHWRCRRTKRDSGSRTARVA